MSPQTSTIVRAKNAAVAVLFRFGGPIMPGVAGRLARDLWFAAPPRMADAPLPPGGNPFTVKAQGHPVSGVVWGDVSEGAEQPKTVYFMHGLGGRGSQFGAMIDPFLTAGYRVVMLDAPAHGESAPGPSGPRRTNGMEFAKALDAACSKFGPADAVVAHSFGVISTYLAMRLGRVRPRHLVAIAPLTEVQSHFNQFQVALSLDGRARANFRLAVDEWVGVPVAEFDARFQAARVEPTPTLVITDRGDRQAPYDGVVSFAHSINAPLITTEGLGHRKILADHDVAAKVVAFVTGQTVVGDLGSTTADPLAVHATA